MFKRGFFICCLLFAFSLLAGVTYAGEQDTADVKSEVESLQEMMKNNPEIMEMIQSLQNDPEFQKALQDPSILNAVNSGDIAALMSNPQFMKLLENSTVQKIEKKVQE